MNKKKLFIASLTALIAVGGQAQSSSTPTVKTNKRFARGATMAFARATFSGSNISERGLCYSTSPTPTVDDQCSKLNYSYDDNGTIYYIDNLEPATKYYMRPYAKTKSGTVGYGDIIKFYTLPKGTITYGIREGGDSTALVRITAATKEAVELWNNLTSIHGVYFNVGHNDGTPTADCSYGGYIRVGSNSSYQRTGTLLHEMLHGIGVGTHSVWWDSNMRSNGDRGYWLGDRATEVLRFLENNETVQLNGDNTHMWPYGINGAHEDSGAKGLYIGNSLICEALGEDGLPPSGGFATPAYTFDQEDTIKYYLKSEDQDHGLYTSFLVPNADGSLAWKTMGNATENDSAAWYVSFVPSKSYYTLRNAATGGYISLQSGKFTTRSTESASSNEQMQLMRGRVDVSEGKDLRGYYIIKNDATLTPPTMAASADGQVSSSAYDLSTSATTQRWMIMTADEVKDFEDIAMGEYKITLDSLVAEAKKLQEVPHVEDSEGADAAYAAEISRIEGTEISDVSTADQLTTSILTAIRTFLASVTPSDLSNPFDLTFYIKNPKMATADGWSSTPTTRRNSCAEFYETSFNMNQTLTDMPKGVYQLRVQAFQRTGSVETSYTAHTSGTESITAEIYANSSSSKIASIWDCAQDASIGQGTQSQKDGKYVPYTLVSAKEYFDLGLYDNKQRLKLFRTGDIKIGIRSTSQPSTYWTAFTNFRLLFFGTQNPPTDGISTVTTEKAATANAIYDLQGRRLNVSDKSQLKKGLYIINGKKTIVR